MYDGVLCFRVPVVLLSDLFPFVAGVVDEAGLLSFSDLLPVFGQKLISCALVKVCSFMSAVTDEFLQPVE